VGTAWFGSSDPAGGIRNDSTCECCAPLPPTETDRVEKPGRPSTESERDSGKHESGVSYATGLEKSNMFSRDPICMLATGEMERLRASLVVARRAVSGSTETSGVEV
jgi:hypothetical protein